MTTFPTSLSNFPVQVILIWCEYYVYSVGVGKGGGDRVNMTPDLKHGICVMTGYHIVVLRTLQH